LRDGFNLIFGCANGVGKICWLALWLTKSVGKATGCATFACPGYWKSSASLMATGALRQADGGLRQGHLLILDDWGLTAADDGAAPRPAGTAR